MNRISHSMLTLIKEYTACSVFFCDELKEKYDIPSVREILRWRRLNKIPKEGKVGDVYFSFHGVGCYFESKTDKIDIDFGSEGRVDGFDYLRLRLFWEQRAERFKDIEDEDFFKRQLETMRESGFIVCPRELPNQELCYLKK